jgi:hypothetical protein
MLVSVQIRLTSICATVILWCSALSHHYFCTAETLPVKKARYLIPLANMLLLMRGTKAQDGLSNYSKLRVFFFVTSSQLPQ